MICEVMHNKSTTPFNFLLIKRREKKSFPHVKQSLTKHFSLYFSTTTASINKETPFNLFMPFYLLFLFFPSLLSLAYTIIKLSLTIAISFNHNKQ
jgi:hypothetical protein